jgi:hypothetical protein
MVVVGSPYFFFCPDPGRAPPRLVFIIGLWFYNYAVKGVESVRVFDAVELSNAVFVIPVLKFANIIKVFGKMIFSKFYSLLNAVECFHCIVVL